ncbi:unnamed protein product, partial [marine sediment metagenome]
DAAITTEVGAIGNNTSGGNAFSNTVDDARIYDRALGAAEIAELAGGSVPPPPPTQYTLTVETAGTGAGSVWLDPAGGVYDEGTVVTLTATGETGSEFTGWSGDLTGSVNPAMVTMDADKAVTATFDRTNTAPVAVATSDVISGVAPLTVNFDGSGSTDADGTIVDYEWDLGDGTGLNGAAVAHTYTGAGVYTVTLYVFDDDGASGEATLTITVTEPQKEPPVAENQSVSVAEDGSVGITLVATDPDGDVLTYAIVSMPGCGELTGTAP